MKKYILKPIFYFVFFVFITIVLLPKENIYYFVEKQLSPYKVIISNENTQDKLLSFIISDGNIYYDNIKFGTIGTLKLDTLLIYNVLNINNIIIDDAFKNFLPKKIENIQINYNIFKDPVNIHISSNGDMGEVNGMVSLMDRKIIINFHPSKIITQKYRSALRQFKFQDGKYIYEYKF